MAPPSDLVCKAALFLQNPRGHMDFARNVIDVTCPSENMIAAGSVKDVYEDPRDPQHVLLVLRGGAPAHVQKNFYLEAAKCIVLHFLLDAHLRDLPPEQRPEYYAKMVTCVEVGKTRDGRMCHVCPKIVSLDTFLKTYGTDTSAQEQAYCICLYQLAKTLNLMYNSFELVHGDMKMDNTGVFVQSERGPVCDLQAYMFDFGLASFCIPPHWNAVLTGAEVKYRVVNTSEHYIGLDFDPTSTAGNNDIAFFLASSHRIYFRFVSTASAELMSKLRTYMNALYRCYHKHFPWVPESFESDPSLNLQFLYGMYNTEAMPHELNQKIQLLFVKCILESYAHNRCIATMLRDKEGDLSARIEENVQRIQAFLAECENTV